MIITIFFLHCTSDVDLYKGYFYMLSNLFAVFFFLFMGMFSCSKPVLEVKVLKSKIPVNKIKKV